MPQDWNWLFAFWRDCKPKNVELKDWRVFPSSCPTGEPWMSYSVAAALAGMGAEAIRKKAVSLPAEFRHPSITGLIRASGFDQVKP